MFFSNMQINFTFGVEIEFYATCSEEINLYNCPLIKGTNIQKEEGFNQFELVFIHTHNIKLLYSNFVKQIMELKKFCASQYNCSICFTPKPNINMPGSALNIHINITDNYNNNLFKVINNNYNAIMLNCIAGMLKGLKNDLHILLPNKESILRLLHSDIHTPTHIAWGVDNRTAALRIPPGSAKNLRIEHRVPSADAKIIDVINKIKQDCMLGIQNNFIPPERIYGICSDQIYSCDKILDYL